MLKCCVTGVGSLIGQGIIRCLKEATLDCRIIGTDYFDHAVGLYWLDRGYILPDLLKKDVSEEQWLKSIMKILKDEKIDIVLIGLDFEVDAFARHRHAIEEKTGAKVIVGSPEAVAICKDKWKTTNFLKEQGLPYPESCLPESRDEFQQTHDFPYIVKPRFGFRSRYLETVTNREELEMAIARCPNPIIQEVIGNDEDEYTCGAIYLDGKVKSTICLKRYLKDGNTARAILTKECYELDEFIREVAGKIKCEGPANFQLRLSDKGPVIFEINPRFSGTTPVRAIFGQNEVEQLIRFVCLGEAAAPSTLRNGVVMRYFTDQYVPMDEFQQWGQS